MNLSSTMFLLAALMGGLLVVTAFYYGAQLVLRLSEIPLPALPPDLKQTTPVHTGSSPVALTQSQVDAAAQAQPAALGFLPDLQHNQLRAPRA